MPRAGRSPPDSAPPPSRRSIRLWRDAIELAAQRIAAYHVKQRPRDDSWVDNEGVRAGYRWNAVEAAGIYVPGGLAAYPSSLLMNAIPAKVAGVERIVDDVAHAGRRAQVLPCSPPPMSRA